MKSNDAEWDELCAPLERLLRESLTGQATSYIEPFDPEWPRYGGWSRPVVDVLMRMDTFMEKRGYQRPA